MTSKTDIINVQVGSYPTEVCGGLIKERDSDC